MERLGRLLRKTEPLDHYTVRLNKRIASILHLLPHKQEGPSCGLAALSMAITSLIHEHEDLNGDYLSNNTDHNFGILNELLNIARELGVSKQGELFAAEWLAAVAVNFHTRIQAQVERFHSPEGLLRLMNGKSLVLICYDKSGNYEPCLANGECAHWAIICGLITAPGNEYYVTAYHGRSKHPQVWALKDLYASNMQLNRCKSSVIGHDFVIPGVDNSANAKTPGDLSECLRGLVVLVDII